MAVVSQPDSLSRLRFSGSVVPGFLLASGQNVSDATVS
ncbi:hypothetical protein DDI_0728 [Dickeya dianthicola RNS04.9]|nr:hypothetical protein DDI_0728 [Dickeya dianthicola RNS04.9]